LLRGKGLGSFYRNTNGFLDFVLGFPGWICGGIGRRFGCLLGAGAGCGEQGVGAGVAGLVDGVGLDGEQGAGLAADGCVVSGGEAAGLTVQLWACVSVDVSCGWHGLVVPNRGLVSGTGRAGVASDLSLHSSVRRWGVIFGKAGWRGRGASGFW